MGEGLAYGCVHVSPVVCCIFFYVKTQDPCVTCQQRPCFVIFTCTSFVFGSGLVANQVVQREFFQLPTHCSLHPMSPVPQINPKCRFFIFCWKSFNPKEMQGQEYKTLMHTSLKIANLRVETTCSLAKKKVTSQNISSFRGPNIIYLIILLLKQ